MIAYHPLAHLVETGVELHHERPDGKGYPHGLERGKIPQDAIVIGICDAFDAMTSQRPYRRPLSGNKAIEILQKGKGTQFEAQWVDYFVAAYDAGRLDGILMHSDDGIPMHQCPVCGPVVTRRRRQTEGDLVYCLSCGREMRLVNKNGELVTKSTWKKGQGEQLVNLPDTELIQGLVDQAIRSMPEELFQ